MPYSAKLLIVTGSGLKVWIYWHFFKITTDYNSCLRLAPFLTGLRLSALQMWRMTKKHLQLNRTLLRMSRSLVESYVTTDGQSASLSWNKEPVWGLRPHFYYYMKVAGLLMWGAVSDSRMGLSFTVAAGPRQRSHSRVSWYSQPYFTVSDAKLPFSSPPMTRRATVEVFDPASTRDMDRSFLHVSLYSLSECLLRGCSHGNVLTEPLPMNGLWRLFVAAGTCVSRFFASDGIPLWLHYSGFRAACHNNLSAILNSVTCFMY
jgi:hypothetical protein